eukprot:CAMPEP_0172435874 /NCGR_PEP_ID=MMETSP1064-20121228/71421_1 /TAXON_ID=202472 /ORGANISM="Aulacoseira subarctica , Strain CCAP 1002/5" /LENGTH=712 /DNA_ID=CAMNT_0013184239 /DNA_START=151 /DNA_END=2291 /DNA_ORIENTATION=+
MLIGGWTTKNSSCFSSSSSSSSSAYEDPTSLSEERAKAREKHLSEVIPSDNNSKNNSSRLRISQVTIAEVLKRKHMLRWVDPVLPTDCTAQQAIVVCIERGLSGMMVVDYSTSTETSSNNDAAAAGAMKRGRVVGMITSRDLLRILAAGIKEEHLSVENIVSRPISEYMTPISQVIYARPEETIGMCRSIMAKLGVKCLPILNDGRVEGLITSRDLSEYGLVAEDRGGKSNFLRDVSERVGLSSVGTSMAEPPAYLQSHLVFCQQPLFLNVGVAELPHPFKGSHGAGTSKNEAMFLHTTTTVQQQQQDIYASDPSYSEDAHFVVETILPHDGDESSNNNNHVSFSSDAPHLKDIVYMGVADGVGSWREYGVDPRLFSHALMEECKSIVISMLPDASVSSSRLVQNHRFPTPAEILAKAHERVKANNILAPPLHVLPFFDGARHQLHFSNLGDSGIIIMRHIDSEVAGALKRDRTIRREERKSDLRVAFVSQQQLKSFNHPYQLGWTGEEFKSEGESKSFKTAADFCTSTVHIRRGDIIVMGGVAFVSQQQLKSFNHPYQLGWTGVEFKSEGESKSFKMAADFCTSTVHIRRGDIIVMASDGLFDNVDIDDIVKITLEWERNNNFINQAGDLSARENRWTAGTSLTGLSSRVIPDLALTLCKVAREKSLDDSTDSPFAILAKGNDIMWSGGMPDDCTVIAMHVVGKPAGADQP